MRRIVPLLSVSLVVALVGCGGSTSNQASSAAAGLRLSATTFNFGQNLVGNASTQTVATVSNVGTTAASLQWAVQGDASFTAVQGATDECGAQLGAGAQCNLDVAYAPTAVNTQSAGLIEVVSGAASAQTVTLTGQSVALPAGVVTATSNPYVALYTLTSPVPGTWSVRFGPTTGYGRTTPVQTIATGGAASTVYVAGMQANSVTHMQATLRFPDGNQTSDGDHTFTTGAGYPGIPASFPVAQTFVAPQPGVELFDPIGANILSTAIATDLSGNVIWAYPFGAANAHVYPVKPLANGDFLCQIAPLSYPPDAEGTINVLREFDLVGNTVRELSVDSLNAAMAAAGLNLEAHFMSHDFAVLPNGHVLVLVTTLKTFTDLPGYPGQTLVSGDAVVDLDANWNPVWVWNEFDHFDIHRQPYLFPDWTHSNSVAYSADDGDFVVSIRHQNWIVKVDYRNGAGTGNLVWTLGEGGDFKLVGGVDPTDWFYAQHDAKFVTAKTAGVFQMTVMDNGDDRQFTAGDACAGSTAPACFYTTIQELQIDETAKTATLLFHQILPPALYSSYAGNVEILANGDFEYALAGIPSGSRIFEVTPGATPATVWQLSTPTLNIYRGFRMPSLYPGVQW